MQQEIKKILITGANGFIGKSVVTMLSERGWKVFKGVRLIDKQDIHENVFIDLEKPESILSLENKMRFDAIVHVGACIGFSGQTESELFVPNILSTGCLAYLARQWQAQFIFTSASIVHGVMATEIEENSHINADTPYAKGKWLAEKIIESSGVDSCILRIAGVFGKDGPKHLGLNRTITAAINGEPPLQTGKGKTLRNYIYVHDVAEIIDYVLLEKLTGVHLVSGSEVLSVNEMLKMICDVFIPGNIPNIKEGKEALDQHVAASIMLPKSRKFYDALLDIKRRSVL